MITRPIISFNESIKLNSNGTSYSAIIIDDSASTYSKDEKEATERYINILKEIIAAIESDSYIEIYTTSRGLQFSGNPADLNFDILNFSRIYSSTPFTNYISLITDSSESNNYFIKRILMVGDKKINSFKKLDSNNFTDFEFYYHPLSPSEGNVGIVDYRIHNETISINQEITIEAEIINFSNKKQMRTIELILNGKKVGQKFVSLSPNETKRVKFKTVLYKEGQNSCIFSIEDDLNILDNKIYFQLNTEKPLTIDLIYNNLDEITYFVNALMTINQNLNNITIRKIDKAKFRNHNLSEADLAIIFGYNTIFDADHMKITDFLNGEKRLIIFPSFTSNINDLSNIKLTDFFQFQVSETPSLINDKKTGKMINNSDSYQFPFGPLSEIKFFSIYNMKPSTNTKIILTSGQSAWNRYNIGKSIVDLFSFSPDYKSTNLVLSSKFIPFCHNLINPYNDSHSYNLNDEFKMSNIYNNAAKILITSPSNNIELVKFSNINNQYLVENFQEPGLHIISDGTNIIHNISVNVDPDEYRSEKIGNNEFLKYFKNFSLIQNIKDTKSIITNNLRATEIWSYLILILCFLFIIEMYLYIIYLNAKK